MSSFFMVLMNWSYSCLYTFFLAVVKPFYSCMDWNEPTVLHGQFSHSMCYFLAKLISVFQPAFGIIYSAVALCTNVANLCFVLQRFHALGLATFCKRWYTVAYGAYFRKDVQKWVHYLNKKNGGHMLSFQSLLVAHAISLNKDIL